MQDQSEETFDVICVSGTTIVRRAKATEAWFKRLQEIADEETGGIYCWMKLAGVTVTRTSWPFQEEMDSIKRGLVEVPGAHNPGKSGSTPLPAPKSHANPYTYTCLGCGSSLGGCKHYRTRMQAWCDKCQPQYKSFLSKSKVERPNYRREYNMENALRRKTCYNSRLIYGFALLDSSCYDDPDDDHT